MSNPNQAQKSPVPAQKTAIPAPGSSVKASAETQEPEADPKEMVNETRLSKAEVAELLGTDETTIDAFEEFRLLSDEAKFAEAELLRMRRDQDLREIKVIEAASKASRSTPRVQKVSEEGEITVFPLRTENRLRVGPRYYQFQARTPVSVPVSIVPHLVEKGIISPPAHLT